MSKRLATFLLAISLVLITLTACGDNMNDANNNVDKQGTLEMAMPPWVNSPPQAYLAKFIIEDHLGWDVNITEADIGLSYASTANGTTDFFVDAWLPGHEPFVEEYADETDLLGEITVLDPPGLVVPDYVEIDSITELNDHKEKFDSEIVGIEPGTAIMDQTDDAIETYDLDFETTEGSDFAMVSVLGDAIDYDEWIVITGWTPHWMFIQYDLKFLEDPEGVYGESNTISAIINKDLHETAPDVVEFLENWEVDVSIWDELIYETTVEERDAEEVVREWMTENEDVIQGWVE